MSQLRGIISKHLQNKVAGCDTERHLPLFANNENSSFNKCPPVGTAGGNFVLSCEKLDFTSYSLARCNLSLKNELEPFPKWFTEIGSSESITYIGVKYILRFIRSNVFWPSLYVHILVMSSA